jgi:hypothetical protein
MLAYFEISIKESTNVRGQFLITLASFVKKIPFSPWSKSYTQAEVADTLLMGKRK